MVSIWVTSWDGSRKKQYIEEKVPEEIIDADELADTLTQQSTLPVAKIRRSIPVTFDNFYDWGSSDDDVSKEVSEYSNK